MEPEIVPLDILFQDADMLVMNKASGMVMQFVPGSVESAVVHYLLRQQSTDNATSNTTSINTTISNTTTAATTWPWKKTTATSTSAFEGIVHRIDKGTSGILVVAKHPTAAKALSKSFQDREVHKTYLAIAIGLPTSDQNILQDQIAALLEQTDIITTHAVASMETELATKQLCQAIKKCGTNADQAVQLLQEAPDPIAAASFSAAMNVCKRAGSRSKGLEVFDSMKLCGVVPNLKCFTKAINFCAKEPPLPTKALELVDYMQECQLSLHPPCVMSAISACGLAGRDVKPALKLLDRLVAEMKASKSNNNNNNNDDMLAGCFKTAITACHRCGATGEALELQDRLSTIMEACKTKDTLLAQVDLLESLDHDIVVDAPIGRMGSRVTPMGVLSTARGGREARSIVTPLLFDGVHSLNRVVIETGRTHQIRVHMSAVLGCPLAGDPNYGTAPSNSDRAVERCMLHAAEITLPHPITGAMMTIACPPPLDFSAMVNTITRNLQAGAVA